MNATSALRASSASPRVSTSTRAPSSKAFGGAANRIGEFATPTRDLDALDYCSVRLGRPGNERPGDLHMTAIRTAAPADSQSSGRTAGEPISLDALYRAFGADVQAWCVRWLGPDDGQDAAHEVLLRAARSTWRGEASVRWWLGTIARNVCSDYARRRSRELPVGLPMDFRHGDVHPSNGRPPAGLLERVEPGTVEDAAEKRARIRLVQHALAALSARDRRYLERWHFQGLTYADMARLDHITSRAAHGRLLRARKRLRTAVEAVAERDRLWPLPALVAWIPRLRARCADLRARATHTFLDHAAVSTAPVSSILGHSAVHIAAAVIGTVSLGLAGDGGAAQAPVDHTDPRAPIAITHEVPEQGGEPAGERLPTPRPRSSHESTIEVSTAQRPSTDQSEDTKTGTAPLPPPPNPTIETDAGDAVQQPIQQRDDTDGEPGFRTTPTNTSVDPGFTEDDIEDRGPSVGLSCGNPEHHGPITKALCQTTGEFSTEDPPEV